MRVAAIPEYIPSQFEHFGLYYYLLSKSDVFDTRVWNTVGQILIARDKLNHPKAARTLVEAFSVTFSYLAQSNNCRHLEVELCSHQLFCFYNKLAQQFPQFITLFNEESRILLEDPEVKVPFTAITFLLRDKNESVPKVVNGLQE